MSKPSPLRLAATAIPVRDSPDGPEVLMVRRVPDVSFGGMWTFPGGAFEAVDGPVPESVDESAMSWTDEALQATARNAAARETREETALRAVPSSMIWLSHWIPPRDHGPPKRFATWFFLALDVDGELDLDERENDDARWVTPSDACIAHEEGTFPLAPPTLVTLLDISGAASVEALTETVRAHGPACFHTRFLSGSPLTLAWVGDAAYESGDPDAPGPRNRAIVGPGGRIRRECS